MSLFKKNSTLPSVALAALIIILVALGWKFGQFPQRWILENVLFAVQFIAGVRIAFSPIKSKLHFLFFLIHSIVPLTILLPIWPDADFDIRASIVVSLVSIVFFWCGYLVTKFHLHLEKKKADF